MLSINTHTHIWLKILHLLITGHGVFLADIKVAFGRSVNLELINAREGM